MPRCPLFGRYQGESGHDSDIVKPTRLTHLRHRLNDEQTDNGHNFLRQVVRLNPWKESGLAQWHRVLVGCAAASMRYHDEIRVFSRLMAKSVVGNNQ